MLRLIYYRSMLTLSGQIETIGDAYWCAVGLEAEADPLDAARSLFVEFPRPLVCCSLDFVGHN